MAGIWYRTGTVALTNGSKRVTGTGTTWLDQATGPVIGNTFWGPDNKPYEVERVVSNTALDLVEAYAGATIASTPYKINTTEKFSVASLAGQVAATLQYAQAQYSNMSLWASGDLSADVPVILPDGVSTKDVPNVAKMLSLIAAKLTETAQLKALDVPSTVFGRARLADASAAAQLTALGASAFGRARLADADAAAQLTALGASAFGRARLADADAAAQRTALALGSASQRAALGTGPLYSRDAILGSVSQTAGVPTGAIFEKGGAGNNTYVKFADGTLICQVVSLGGVIGGAGALVNLTWTFPVTPVGVYNVIPTWTIEAGYNKGTLQVQTKASQTVRILCEVSSGVSGYVDAVLIGRWY